jgi:hypothetical protein
MKNSITLSYAELHGKLKQLEEEKHAIEYLIKNYFSENQGGSPSLFDGQQMTSNVTSSSNLDAAQNTKPLIIDILKKEGRPMKWKEVFDIFSKLKPEIREGTVRVSLSELGRMEKYPVGYKNEQYWYEEKSAV